MTFEAWWDENRLAVNELSPAEAASRAWKEATAAERERIFKMIVVYDLKLPDGNPIGERLIARIVRQKLADAIRKGTS